MKESISKETLDSVKRSYFNILALFMANDKIDSRFVVCFLKWGFQLRLNPDDVSKHGLELETIKFQMPEDKLEKLEAIYHLVFMIQLDNVVEDAELEIATIYAKQLGFSASTVAELFKSIATAAYDGDAPRDAKKEVIEFLKMNE